MDMDGVMKTPLLLLLAAAVSLNAEGLSFDENGKLAWPHTEVVLNGSQQEEIIAMDSVTLTKAQWQKLRAISPGVPKRLNGFISITHNDCTCGLGFAGVQLSKERIAVLHQDQTVSDLKWRLSGKRSLQFQVDERGQFYFDGRLIRFQILLDAISASDGYVPRPAGQGLMDINERNAVVSIPFGMQEADPVFEDRLKLVTAALNGKNWNAYVYATARAAEE